MSNLLAWAQLSVASSQLSELHALNAQFHAQRNAQLQQAVLADVLFHTERRAKQLSAVAQADPIVAAILADEWLGSVRHMSENLFHQVEHKRLWAGAAGRLHALRGPLGDPGVGAMVHHVRTAAAEIGSIYRDLGEASSHPEAAVASLHQYLERLANDSQQRLGRGIWTGGGCAIALLSLWAGGSFLAWLVETFRGKDYTADPACFNGIVVLAGIGLLCYLVVTIHRWSELRSQVGRAKGNLDRINGALAKLQSFTADPSRGGILQRFYREHPAYGRPLPNVDDLPATAGHVVERQTVVVRCKYCAALTPVGGQRCHNCGAANFA